MSILLRRVKRRCGSSSKSAAAGQVRCRGASPLPRGKYAAAGLVRLNSQILLCTIQTSWRLPDQRLFDVRGLRRWNGVMNTNQTSGPLFNWTQGIYALHAFSLLVGIFGAATVIGAFLIGWPSIIAVILNYVKRGDVRGTWLESHFRWQIRTFWYGALWVGLCLLFIILTLGVGILIAWLPLAIVSIWFIYRIARGWMRLRDGRPMYA